MKISKCLIVTILITACFMLTPRAFALSVGQIDTFEVGTTQNWVVAVGPYGASHPAPPFNVPSGGPSGVDDNYLLLTAAGGTGPGSRLSAINLIQWAGDYITDGITAISMDLYNQGQTDLYLRLLFADPIPGPATNLAFSANAIFLPAGGGWTSVVFPVTPTDLNSLYGTVTAALMNTTEMRIVHAQTPPSYPVLVDGIAAQLAVDNIRALNQVAPIPEPATMLLLASGLAGLAGYGRKRFFDK